MENITCNVIQDILTLYVDDMVSEDTKLLVEKHIQECDCCRHELEKMCAELKEQETAPENSANRQTEIDGLRSFKKFLFRKKVKTILISIIASVALLIGAELYMNWKTVYINYNDAGITILTENAEEVVYTTSIRGNYHSVLSVDTETGIATIHFEQSLREKYILPMFYPVDHIHLILKEDMIEEWYTDSDGNKTLIWEASDEEKEFYFLPGRDKALG